jgi:mycothiol synthase
VTSGKRRAGVAVRPAKVEDAGGIAELCNALAARLYGDTDVNEAEVRRWFRMRGLERLVAERDGRIVGYVDFERRPEGQFPLDARVHPEAWGNEVADALLAAAERWAEERALPGDVLRAYTAEPDVEIRAALEARSFWTIRHSFHMRIDLEAAQPPTEWPQGISVRAYDPEADERGVYEAHMEAFADHWDFHPLPIEEWRQRNFESEHFEPSLWILAEEDGQLAGISLNFWHFSGDPAFGWVGVLAVRRPWRRRGLGFALLRHSFADFRARGATKVALGVDAENLTGAVRLYERAGMHVARRYDWYEKRLD